MPDEKVTTTNIPNWKEGYSDEELGWIGGRAGRDPGEVDREEAILEGQDDLKYRGPGA